MKKTVAQCDGCTEKVEHFVIRGKATICLDCVAEIQKYAEQEKYSILKQNKIVLLKSIKSQVDQFIIKHIKEDDDIYDLSNKIDALLDYLE